VIRYISDRVAVMHLGRIVESGPCEQIFSRPEHAYTRGLLDAVPDADSVRIRQRRTVPVAAQ
jgi:ABC-type oligopeptide transport system ATPase subunit